MLSRHAEAEQIRNTSALFTVWVRTPKNTINTDKHMYVATSMQVCEVGFSSRTSLTSRCTPVFLLLRRVRAKCWHSSPSKRFRLFVLPFISWTDPRNVINDSPQLTFVAWISLWRLARMHVTPYLARKHPGAHLVLLFNQQEAQGPWWSAWTEDPVGKDVCKM